MLQNGMKHHTQSQYNMLTFYFINKCQPFSQRMILYLRDIHNTQSNHIFLIVIHISHSSQIYGQQ